MAITDEIYEHILYDGAVHVPIATLPGMAERTITINGMSKTYSVTGWRVGWAIAPPRAHGRHPQGARLPDRRRGGAAAGGGRRWPCALPDAYYTELADGLRPAARPAAGDPGPAPGFRDVPAARAPTT